MQNKQEHQQAYSLITFVCTHASKRVCMLKIPYPSVVKE